LATENSNPWPATPQSAKLHRFRTTVENGMSAPPAARGGEIDVWWGSHAGRAMLPSFVVCGLLTLLLYVVVHAPVLERGWQQLAFGVSAGAVWLAQLWRWYDRYFTRNYRLTTRHLYVDHGFRRLRARRCDLRQVRGVEVRRYKLAAVLGVGDVWVFCDDGQLPAVLEALMDADGAAELIRTAAAKALQE
jgi:hypothetical protein